MKALDPERFTRLKYATVIRVHYRVEALLKASGWNGSSAELWAEFTLVANKLLSNDINAS